MEYYPLGRPREFLSNLYGFEKSFKWYKANLVSEIISISMYSEAYQIYSYNLYLYEAL